MTALIGLKFVDAVLLTADKRVSYRDGFYRDDFKKVLVLNSKTIMGCVGTLNIYNEVIPLLIDFVNVVRSPNEIIAKAKYLFRLSSDNFKIKFPYERYAITCFIAGLDKDDKSFMVGITSDDNFEVEVPVELPFKAEPEEESRKLKEYLQNQINFTSDSLEYLVCEFSHAIRNVKNDNVGNSTFSIFLSKRHGLLGVEVDEKGNILGIDELTN